MCGECVRCIASSHPIILSVALQDLTPARLEQLWKAVNPGGEKLSPVPLRRALGAALSEDGNFAKALITMYTFGPAAVKKIADAMKLPNVTQKSDIVERQVANMAIRLLFSHRKAPGAPPVSREDGGMHL